MIRFRQKNFGAPVVAAAGGGLLSTLGNIAMIGGTAAMPFQMAQASKQAKEAEEQNEKMIAAQKKENAKLTKALNNIAKEAKNNPQVATQAGQLVAQNKTFAAPARLIAKGSQVAKDMIRAAGGGGKIGKSILGLGSAGLATGAAMYAVDKAQTADARRIGMMPKKGNVQQRSYAAPSVMSQIGTYAKKAGKYLVSKENLKKSAGWAAAGAGISLGLGYLPARAQFKGQQREQENIASQQLQQRSYAFNMASAEGVKGFVKSMNPKTWQITKTPGKTTTGFIATMGSMGMIGRRDIGKFAGNLVTDPKSSKLSKKIGGWMLAKDKSGKFIKDSAGNFVSNNKANLAVGLGAGSVLTGAYGAGEKIVRKTAKAVDKDAYAYENFQNQQVQQ